MLSQMSIGRSCTAPFILFRFEWNFNFLGIFSKDAEISNSMEIRPVVPCGRSDGRKLIVVFRNFATVPDNMLCYYTFAHHTFVECCCKALTLRSCYSRERRSSIIDVLLYTAAVLCRGMNKVMVTSHCSSTVLGRLSVGVTVFTWEPLSLTAKMILQAVGSAAAWLLGSQVRIPLGHVYPVLWLP